MPADDTVVTRLLSILDTVQRNADDGMGSSSMLEGDMFGPDAHAVAEYRMMGAGSERTGRGRTAVSFAGSDASGPSAGRAMVPSAASSTGSGGSGGTGVLRLPTAAFYAFALTVAEARNRIPPTPGLARLARAQRLHSYVQGLRGSGDQDGGGIRRGGSNVGGGAGGGQRGVRGRGGGGGGGKSLAAKAASKAPGAAELRDGSYVALADMRLRRIVKMTAAQLGVGADTDRVTAERTADLAKRLLQLQTSARMEPSVVGLRHVKRLAQRLRALEAPPLPLDFGQLRRPGGELVCAHLVRVAGDVDEASSV